jgi:hypothetical protein
MPPLQLEPGSFGPILFVISLDRTQPNSFAIFSFAVDTLNLDKRKDTSYVCKLI